MPDELVPREISLAKLDRDYAHFERNPDIYRERGWIVLRRAELELDIAFAARVQDNSSAAPLPVMTACVRFDYSNYDLMPPSVRFVDFFTGAPITPHVRALVISSDREPPNDLLVNGHPATNEPFLCVPGTREYHTHPQHTGDSWLLHRGRGAGTLVALCDVIWRSMSRNVLGFRITAQMLPPPFGAQPDVRLVQGDVDALRAQLSAATGLQAGQR
jgi:Predicted metal binding domain